MLVVIYNIVKLQVSHFNSLLFLHPNYKLLVIIPPVLSFPGSALRELPQEGSVAETRNYQNKERLPTTDPSLPSLPLRVMGSIVTNYLITIHLEERIFFSKT
jgi:hypothetical protein